MALEGGKKIRKKSSKSWRKRRGMTEHRIGVRKNGA